MDMVKKAEIFAKRGYAKNDPKHQWAHIEAVRKQAMLIAKQLKGVDYELLELAILFHDIDYHSEASYEENYKRHVENSANAAEKFLMENNYPAGRIEKVKQIILDHSTPYRLKAGDS
ncbi:MAG: HDIG domain-containing protein [Candidatus Diapherotrites archaeon]|nr:HDIG domain-containing protein [Candidatus Diapherotrites archaeon]